MARAPSIEPIVGDWYSSHGVLLEVVAVDEAENAVEVQYADGTVAELDLDEWLLQSKSGALRNAEPPEDVSGAIDVENDDDGRQAFGSGLEDEASLRAGGLDALDLFE